MSDKLTFSQTVAAPATAVYRAFTNGPALQQWLCNNAQVSARAGGRLYLYWRQGYYAAGEFTAVSENETVSFSWQGKGEDAPSAVQVQLSEQDGQTSITLTHDNLGSGDHWDETRTQLIEGWETGLANLKSVLETGLDQRVFARPFMGILIAGVISSEEAEALKVDGGIRISGTMDGTGAAAAGLQANDIITQLGGEVSKDFATLQAALAPFNVGDEIKVTYYRDGEQHSSLMPLKTRPVPTVPETQAALAAQLETTYAALAAEMDAILAEVTEEEASWRPKEDAWNAKEIVGHLITTERATQFGIALQLSEQTAGFPNNPPAWLASVTAVYPTLSDLVAAWNSSNAETVALVAALPDTFVARKADFLNLATLLDSATGLPAHTRTHFNEIRETVAAAKA